MTLGFWVLAGLLIACALAFLVRPLLWGAGRGDADLARKLKALKDAHAAGVLGEAEFTDKLKALVANPSVEARPAPARRVALVLALLLPLAATALYLMIGSPAALDPARVAAPAPDAANPHAGGGDASGPEMAKAVEGLAARMQKQPNDLEGWLLLGRAYLAMQRFADARDALKHAIDLAPGNDDVTVEYAEALALSASTRRIEGEPRAMIERVLKKDPKHQRALWLTGIAEAQDEHYPQAVKAWETLLAELPADAEIAQSVRAQIKEARERAGMPPAPNVPTAAPAAPAAVAAATDNPAAPSAPATASGGASITVRVELAPELKSKVAPDAALFVFARAVSGPPMPLAVRRMKASELPATVQLNDGMGMTPQMNLSSAAEVIVGARISNSGNATPSSGDLQALSQPVSTKARGAEITLTIKDVVK
jgi:cytochrome c-type biogenesis protein CcmH